MDLEVYFILRLTINFVKRNRCLNLYWTVGQFRSTASQMCFGRKCCEHPFDLSARRGKKGSRNIRYRPSNIETEIDLALG